MPGILVITTGGTIGALAHPDPRNPPRIVPMPPDGRDIVREALRSVFQSFNARCISVEPRDSQLVDLPYLSGIVSIIETAPEHAIMITYGTDALLKGADFFHEQFENNPALKNKKLIMTGSMIPLSNGEESDGYRNPALALKLLRDDFETLSKTNIVLSDFDADQVWKPRLYPYQPGKYEKFYDTDQRYNRLRQLS